MAKKSGKWGASKAALPSARAKAKAKVRAVAKPAATKPAAKPAANRAPKAATKDGAAPVLAGAAQLDDFIAAAAQLLDLPVEPEWLPAIKMNLQVTLRQAALVTEFALPDDAEPAPVFEA